MKMIMLFLFISLLSLCVVSASPYYSSLTTNPSSNSIYIQLNNYSFNATWLQDIPLLNQSINFTQASNPLQYVYKNDSTNSNQFMIYNRSLVGLFNLDNSSSLGENSSLIVDVSLYVINGTCGKSCPAFNISGRYNGGYTFNGTNFFNITTSTIGLTSTQTKSFWIYPFAVSQGNNLYLIDEGNNNNWVQLFNGHSATSPFLTIRTGQSGGFFIDGNFNFSTAFTWYNVVVTTNSSATATTECIYVNGVKDFCNTGSQVVKPKNITLGSFFGGNFGFNGTIDQFMLWNRSLSAFEVSELYNMSLTKMDNNNWSYYTNTTNGQMCYLLKNGQETCTIINVTGLGKLSGTAGVEFNSVNYTSATNYAGNSFNVSFLDLGVGTYPYYYFATDSNGNYNFTSKFNYTITQGCLNNQNYSCSTATTTSKCRYKKLGYYNLNMPFLKEVICNENDKITYN